jgi:hypothetical protein
MAVSSSLGLQGEEQPFAIGACGREVRGGQVKEFLKGYTLLMIVVMVLFSVSPIDY